MDLGEVVGKTCYIRKKVDVYYRAQDQDAAMLIMNFINGINEEIKTR
ncbi:MAG: hypothetical protein ACT6FE_08035 [Methanosarcinaceae archaeon]